jgi:exopolysaccharide biosynthesis protein
LRAKKWLKRIGIFSGLMIYLAVSTLLLVFYGPFEQIRSTVVGSILTSRHPQYAEFFLSPEELRQYQPMSIQVASNGGDQEFGSFADVSDDRIEVVEIDDKLFSGKLMIVHDPKRLKVTVTRYINDVGELVSEMAEQADAVAAVNAGGFYDVAGRGTGGIPLGLTVVDGKVITPPTTADPIIGFNREGALIIGKFKPEEVPNLNLVEAVSFGPQLVHEGKGMITSGDGGWGRSARTAIGQRRDGAVLLLVVQGRGTGGIGATLKDLERILLQHGAQTAANLDGGFSSEMWLEGQLIVPPSNPLGERPVATAFVVSKPRGGGNKN